MKFVHISGRNTKEILRDPVSSIMGIALPILMLLLFTSLGSNNDIPVFTVTALTPGVVVFSYAFLIMFSAMLLARDRKTSFLARLFMSPLRAFDYIAGYSLPFLLVALLQTVACFGAALLLGLPLTVQLISASLILLPSAVFTISIGLIMGSLLNENQISAFGSIFIVVASLFSGAWMDLHAVGGIFSAIGYALPFAHTIDGVRGILYGDPSGFPEHLYWVTAYAVISFVAAVLAFRSRMRVR